MASEKALKEKEELVKALAERMKSAKVIILTFLFTYVNWNNYSDILAAFILTPGPIVEATVILLK